MKLEEEGEQKRRKAELVRYFDLDRVNEKACDHKVAHDPGITLYEVGMEEYEE